MSTFQSAFDELESEVKAILEAAGYIPGSVILKIKLDPHDGWQFECLAIRGNRAVRDRLVDAGQADCAEQFLDVLRLAVIVPQLQLL